MRTPLISTSLVVLMLALAGPLAAAPVAGSKAAELLFDNHQLDGIATGTTIAYAHQRVVPNPELMPAITNGSITIELTQPDAAKGTGRETVVRLDDGVRQRVLDNFPADAGNPVLVTFLESSVNAMARLAGGSPFYIRNRIKDAMAKGGDVEEATDTLGGAPVKVTRVVFEPFAADPNRAKMGAFADLTLTFVVSPDLPGHFLRLTAATADRAVFHEEIALTKTGG